MTIGLDLGSHQFRSIRQDREGLVARRCPAVFAALSDTPAHRRLLQQSTTRYVTCSDHLLLVGDEACEWSEVLNVPLFPLLKGGRVPTSDVIARQILTLMIDAMLPIPDSIGTLCCMTVPGGNDKTEGDRSDAEFFGQMVTLRGYRPEMITATQALVLAELHQVSFTGIAISIGHSTCEFGLAHCGREVARCVVANGLESFEASQISGRSELIADSDQSRAVFERTYSRFISDVVNEAKIQFELDGTLKMLPQPLPVICAGSITKAQSFLPMLQRIWNESGWCVATLPICLASDPVFAIARGCLIRAELDQPTHREAA